PWRREDAAGGRAGRVDSDPLEVTTELLDGVDRPDALDLDRDPPALRVTAHEVDGPDVRRPFAPHEPQVFSEHVRALGQKLLELAFDTVLFERYGAPQLVCRVAEDLKEADLQTVFVPSCALAHDNRTAVLLDRRGRGHPVQRLVAAGVGVDEDRPVRFQHHEPGRLRQERIQAAAVADLAAGDDQAHGGGPYRPLRTCLVRALEWRPAPSSRGISTGAEPF